MHTLSTRILVGFIAGFLSHIIFQDGFGSLLFAVNVLPTFPFSFTPVPPFGVPKTLNFGFWAGLWGVGYALIEPRLTPLFGRWFGGFIYGLAPLAGYWFVVLPLKGLSIGGGFHPATGSIQVGFHVVFGLGTAILFRSGKAFFRRRVRVLFDAFKG